MNIPGGIKRVNKLSIDPNFVLRIGIRRAIYAIAIDTVPGTASMTVNNHGRLNMQSASENSNSRFPLVEC